MPRTSLSASSFEHRGATQTARGLFAIVVVAGSLMTACGAAESTVKTSVDEDSWMILSPSKVQARVGKLAGGKVSYAINDQVIAEASLAQGTTTQIAIDGQACDVEQSGFYETTDSDYRPSNRKPTTSRDSSRTRTRRGVNLLVRCANGPVPGTEASLRGANARRAFPPAMIGLLPGLLVGFLGERDRIGSALLVSIGTVLVAILLGVLAYSGFFAITMPVVFGGYALIGGFGGTSSARMRTAAPAVVLSLASIAGAVPVLFIYPTWGVFGPLLAFAAAAIATIVGAVVYAIVK